MSLKNDGIDYKNMIISIIMRNEKPITVKELLSDFTQIYGYSFPFQKFSCRTCMDYFRLYPALFKVNIIKLIKTLLILIIIFILCI